MRLNGLENEWKNKRLNKRRYRCRGGIIEMQGKLLASSLIKICAKTQCTPNCYVMLQVHYTYDITPARGAFYTNYLTLLTAQIL